MIIPKYWADAKIKSRIKGRQVTIMRFGWSDESESLAQEHADLRVKEALELFKAGENISRRELKTSYGGGNGLPIREEIVAQNQDVIITRNSYGALCLNTPDVLFADVDFEHKPSMRQYQLAFTILMFIALGTGFLKSSFGLFFLVGILSLLFVGTLAEILFNALMKLTGGAHKRAKERILRFSEENPDWHLRCYRTPAGYRILVMHEIFDPNGNIVSDFFRLLNVDQIYSFICKKQQCFRARVSPKPWRMGIKNRLKPRPGVWPINPERMPARKLWVENYDRIAQGFASCRFEEQLGSSVVNRKAEYVMKFHDEYCKVYTDLPIA